MSVLFPSSGLYVITDCEHIAAEELLRISEAILPLGVAVMQYRNKQKTHPQYYDLARALAILCRRYQVPLIINDDCELAVSVAAAGVHIGRNDATISEAREKLRGKGIIGVSCYNDSKRVDSAVVQEADYIALGSFFPSTSKPNATRVELSLLQSVSAEVSLPVVAIGGIRPHHIKRLAHTGADLFAVISGIWQAADPVAALQCYNAALAALENP